ncbi:potassium channel family protein [Enorma phocaeensis]|uniref:TrkA family potassium uptake protein n=1 Tax=Enorma phocaeensis TaxID=1871019 RepID=A0ABT7VAZ5_9ACTN|nr:TrkA family potassium uptake protein [Enorma phocaeensis]MBM6953291.1 TrkA family potassium uptake protein [Enorma phocaeensis]MDM8275677.1 TrkA family potassium uptake protein [Enorma phocaeensis]
MNVIVVGVGFMGAGLVARLSRQGFDVTAVDRDQKALDALDPSCTGKRICGVGFDRAVLEEAGIDRASAVVACMRSDEANIVVAHVARSTFRVPRVIARLHDLSKAETYRRLNIQTISPNAWGVARTCELLTYQQLDGIYDIGSGEVRLVRADVPKLLDGATVRELTAVGEVQVVSVSRNNETFIPTQGTVLAEGDIIYAVVATSASRKFKQMLGMGE